MPWHTANVGRAPLDVGEIGLEDQRAVTEQPDAGLLVEPVHALVDRDGVVGHGAWG
jgi:hypothetical protein